MAGGLANPEIRLFSTCPRSTAVDRAPFGGSDFQIKNRGYRLELGEVETALQTLPKIRDCVVVGIASRASRDP